MLTTKVEGKNRKHKVLLYAISTCGWCRRAKQNLKDLDVEYEYIDVDLCSGEDRQEITKDILSRKGQLAYPTVIVDGKILLTGPSKEELQEVLEL
ncbi:MAG: glutaredoxin family protein [Candidatus Bathyarchaeia archaeon]